MSKIATPANVGWYAVAKTHNGKVMVATGPHPASDAHRRVDTEIRPETRRRGLTFTEVGVIRMVAAVGKTLPTYTIEDGRAA